MPNYDLEDALILLHGIARTVERDLGFGDVSQRIRQAADKLNEELTNKNLKTIKRKGI
jgi:hypothetical protein